MGQDIRPERYDPLVDQQDPEDLRKNLQQMRGVIRQTAEAAPAHEQYIAVPRRSGVRTRAFL